MRERLARTWMFGCWVRTRLSAFEGKRPLSPTARRAGGPVCQLPAVRLALCLRAVRHALGCPAVGLGGEARQVVPRNSLSARLKKD